VKYVVKMEDDTVQADPTNKGLDGKFDIMDVGNTGNAFVDLAVSSRDGSTTDEMKSRRPGGRILLYNVYKIII